MASFEFVFKDGDLVVVDIDIDVLWWIDQHEREDKQMDVPFEKEGIEMPEVEIVSKAF